MEENILYVRSAPYDLNLNSYNVQEVGLAKAFCRIGYNVDVVVFTKKHPKQSVFYEYNGHKARWIEKNRFRWFRWGINLSICKDDFLLQYDYVISSEYMQIQTYLLSKKVKDMFIYNGPYYNLFMFKWTSPIYDYLFTRKLDKSIKHIFTKSILAENYLRKKGYKHITTVGVGLDTERFDSCQEMSFETQQIVEYMIQNKCLLYVGALSERKNYRFMLQVYAKVLEYDPTIKFVVIGKSKINPYYKLIGKKDNDYEKTCMTNLPPKIKNGIYRIEKINNSQLKYIYPLAKAFLLPSVFEIFGMVLMEAMYLGAPVITSENGGSMTLIHGKNTGQIIKDFNSEKWSKAVIKYLTDMDYTQQVIQNAQKIIREEYNWDIIAKKMSSTLKNLNSKQSKIGY